MGIREAIEWHAAHTVLENGRDQEVFDKTIVKVLSILGEYLGERVFVGHRISEVYGKDVWQPKGQGLEAGMDAILAKRGVKPGDRISIYVRRKDEPIPSAG